MDLQTDAASVIWITFFFSTRNRERSADGLGQAARSWIDPLASSAVHTVTLKSDEGGVATAQDRCFTFFWSHRSINLPLLLSSSSFTFSALSLVSYGPAAAGKMESSSSQGLREGEKSGESSAGSKWDRYFGDLGCEVFFSSRRSGLHLNQHGVTSLFETRVTSLIPSEV
jgi:hypothetical protein